MTPQEIPLPETPAAEIALPDTPAKEIALPDSTTASPSPFADDSLEEQRSHRGRLLEVSPKTTMKLKDATTQNPFTAPETNEGPVRRRTNTLLSQAMQPNRGPSAFTSATELPLPVSAPKIPLPESPQPSPQPKRMTQRRSSFANYVPHKSTTPNIQRPHFFDKVNINSKISADGNEAKLLSTSGTSSVLFTPSSSDEEAPRSRPRVDSTSTTSRVVPQAQTEAQNEMVHQRRIVEVRVPVAYRRTEVIVVNMPRIVAMLILAMAAVVGVLVGAGSVYYLSL